MKLRNIILSFVFALMFVVVPFSVQAQNNLSPECQKLMDQIEANSKGDFNYFELAKQLPKYCNEGQVYNKVVNFLYYIVGIAAVLSIIYGGYMYMTAGSNDSRRTKGKNIIIYTIAGVALAILAVVIVTVVANLIVDNKFF